MCDSFIVVHTSRLTDFSTLYFLLRCFCESMNNLNTNYTHPLPALGIYNVIQMSECAPFNSSQTKRINNKMFSLLW